MGHSFNAEPGKRKLADWAEEGLIIAKSQLGKQLQYSTIQYDQSSCVEFIIAWPSVNIKRQIALAFIVPLIVYYCTLTSKFHSECFLSSIVFAALVLCWIYFQVRKESLLVIKSLGVQITRSYSFGRETSKFYDLSEIKDILINEAISMHRVIFYITILLKDEEKNSKKIGKSVPLFQTFSPPLSFLQKIYQGTQQHLWEEEEVYL